MQHRTSLHALVEAFLAKSPSGAQPSVRIAIRAGEGIVAAVQLPIEDVAEAGVAVEEGEVFGQESV